MARGLIGLLTKTGKKFDPFFDPPGDVFGQKGVKGESWREFLAQMFP